MTTTHDTLKLAAELDADPTHSEVCKAAAAMLREQCKLIRELESEVEALKGGQAEPFGYFRAEPFGWTDCAEADEGAIALYERPATPTTKETL